MTKKAPPELSRVERWLGEVERVQPMLFTLVAKAHSLYYDGDEDRIRLVFSPEHELMRVGAEQEPAQEFLVLAANHIFGRSMQIQCETGQKPAED